MQLKFILFAIIPGALMLAISFIMPFWKNKLMTKTGQIIVPLAKRKSKLQLIAIPTAYVLLILSILFDFGKMSFVIPYCAVLGLFITIKESTLLPVNGVYENLIISGTDIIKITDITGIENPDTSITQNTLKIQTTHGSRTLTFDNSNELLEVLSVLKKKV
jgi:hypothetical protein